MQLTNVSLKDIKKINNLEEEIRINVLKKNNYGDITFKEIIEFINEIDDFKLQIFYPDSLNITSLISYLKDKVSKETKNRIRSGENEIIKKAISPYKTFISSSKNKDKILEIIDTIIKNLEIENDIDLLRELLNIETIKDIIKQVYYENRENVIRNNYTFTRYENIRKLIKLYSIKDKYQTHNSYKNLDYLIEKNDKSKKIQELLRNNNIMERYIYILLFRLNIFDYEPESIENLSIIFDLSKERILMDQDKAIKVLFQEKLVDKFTKICGHQKEIYKYLCELHANGFNPEEKPDIKDARISIYTKNLCILTNTTKEDLIEIIKKLNLEDQKYIKDKYTVDFELIDKNSYSKEKIMAITQKIKRLINDKSYKPKSNKNSNLYVKLNIEKDKLKEIINGFTALDQEVIHRYYDEEFNCYNPAKTTKERVKLNNLIKDIKEANINSEFNPKYFKNLYLRINITKEKLESIITKLSEEERTKLNNWYDECWDEKIENQSGEDKKEITKIVIKLKSYIRNKQPKNIKKLCLYDYFNISKEVMNQIIIKLPEEDQIYIFRYYNDDFEFKYNLPEDETELTFTKNKLRKIKITIGKLIKDPDYLIKKQKKNIIKRKITLCELLDIPLEELKVIIEKLSIKDKNILRENYNENYERIKNTSLTKEEQLKLNGRLNIIRGKIRRLYRDPNYGIRTGKKKEKIPNPAKTLYENLELSREELEFILTKLNNTDQRIIQQNYDENFNRIKLEDKSREESVKIYGRLYVIRKKIKKLHNNPDALILGVKRKPKEYITLYQMMNITKEELVKAIEKLSEKDRDLLISAYDDEFHIIRQKVTDKKEASARRNKLSYIRNKLKKIINGEDNNRRKNLCIILKIKESKLRKIIQKLSIKDQEFIKTQYDDNYEPIIDITLSKEEMLKNINKMSIIRKKIRQYLKDPNYIEGRQSKTLCERLNTDLITTNKLIMLLSDDERDLVLEVYDELNSYSKNKNSTKEKTQYVNTRIIPKLKRYLNNGMQVIKRKEKKNNNTLDLIIPTQTQEEKLNILELIIMTSIASGENYSTKAISKFLGIEEVVVIDMIKNYLINCKEKYNQALSEQLNSLETLKLERSLPNKKEENN